MAVAALQAADEYFKESKRACESFNASPPLSRCAVSSLLFSSLLVHDQFVLWLMIINRLPVAFLIRNGPVRSYNEKRVFTFMAAT